jgi:hypothetical protein
MRIKFIGDEILRRLDDHMLFVGEGEVHLVTLCEKFRYGHQWRCLGH